MRVTVTLLVLLATLGACTRAGPEAEQPPKASVSNRTSVILLSIDNLRPDRLGVYGEDRPTSPQLDRLAAQSVVFDNAYATAPWTLPSHMSMFSGLHPKSHRAVTALAKAAPEIPMLAEILRAHRYRTFAVTGGGYVGAAFGFDRGFEQYEVAWATRRVVRETLDRLRDTDQSDPYFLFVHTFGVHCPFNVPPRYREQFDRRPPADHVDVLGKCGDTHYSKMELTPGQISFISDRYDAGIRRTDDDLAPLFELLEERGDLDRAILIVTSDHGEEFDEHGRMGHGRALYSESLRVPLLIRIPGVAPRRVATPVSLVDLAPTVLDLLDLPADGMEGQSLAPLLAHGDAAADGRPLYAETELRGESGRTVIFRGYQLITDDVRDRTELFELRSDPEQKRPLGEARAQRAELAGVLEDHFPRGRPRPITKADPPAERLEQLRALGYIE